MPSTLELDAAAEAMSATRRELIAKPLQSVWPQLAKAALEAAERARDAERRRHCKHLNKMGDGWVSSDGKSGGSWRCTDCGVSHTYGDRNSQL